MRWLVRLIEAVIGLIQGGATKKTKMRKGGNDDIYPLY